MGSTDEYITIRTKPSSSISGNSLTIEFWVYLEAFSAGGYYKLLSTVSTNPYLFVTETSGYQLTFENVAQYRTAVPLRWQHIAIAASDSGDSLYVDGELVTTLPHLAVSYTSSMICQVDLLLATVWLKQLRIWNKVLSQTQLQQFSRMYPHFVFVITL